MPRYLSEFNRNLNMLKYFCKKFAYDQIQKI